MHGKYVPETTTIYDFLVNKGFKPKKHTYLVKVAFAANAESEVGKNLYLLQQMDNDNNRAQEWAKNNATAPSNRPNYVPRKHGETNASLELLRNDEAVGKRTLLEYYHGNPDNISCDGYYLWWTSEDAVTFGYFPVTLDNKYKFFSSQQNEAMMTSHYDLAYKAAYELIKGRKKSFNPNEFNHIVSCVLDKGVLLGRCWMNAGVISFWTPIEIDDRDYSHSNVKPSDLVKVLNDLGISENEYSDWTLVTVETGYGVTDYVNYPETTLAHSHLEMYDPSYKINAVWELKNRIWNKIEAIVSPPSSEEAELSKRQQIDSKLGNMTYAKYRSMLYQEGEKPSLTVLWLDDQREPYRYLNSKSASNTFARNKQFYDTLSQKYDIKFVWVKNIYQFIEYIEKNGVPPFISFDHDLNNRGGGEGLSDEQKLNNNGVNCAKWLVEFCKKNKINLPKFYVHSANPKHGPEINNVLNSNRMVEGKNDNKRRKIYMNESQLRRLLENSIDDGFRMSFSKENGQINQNNPNMVMFDPNAKGYADTKIFKDGGKEFNVYYQDLPKSGLKSINLYYIRNMNINKALKHGKNVSGNKVNIGDEKAANSLEYFKKRSAYYITRILNKMGVMPDVFTSPQSSSKFNESMLQLLSKYYPNGDVFLMPNSMRKDPRNVYVDINAAKTLGMSDDDIAKLQNKVDNMKKDEDIRDFRRKIEQLKKEIEELYAQRAHKRGRPSKKQISDIWDKRDEINAYSTLIKANRRRGRDSTIDSKTGEIKPMQIKSMDDIQRRAIDGLFVFNDIDYPSRTYSVGNDDYTYSQSRRLKNKVVLVFDDNLSSGATLDMMCAALLKMGTKKVIPITLGLIPQTAYNPSERANLRH